MTAGRTILALATMTSLGAALGACATTGSLPPTEAVRYHLGGDVARGTVAVAAASPDGGPAPLEAQGYVDAVRGALLRNGYTLAAPGAPAQYVAAVSFRRGTELGPPTRSPFSIGLGGGGFSAGRRSGVGLGGGVGFPIGGGRRREITLTELSVVISRRADQTRLWEGQAHTAVESRNAAAADAPVAAKLADALFTGFPGESGRTIEVK